MARSTVRTLLSLNRYARVMGLDDASFNNMTDGVTRQSAHAYWTQSDHDELAACIAQAEARLAAALRFDVAPTARTDAIRLAARGGAWWNANLTAPRGHITAFGTPVFTLLKAGAAVTVTGDTATVSVTGVSASLDPATVRVYYRVADGADAAASAAYRIHDVRCAVSGTTLTIGGPKAYFAALAVLEADAPADYDAAGSYVSAVDVYTEAVNEELPLTLVWDAVQENAGSDPTARLTQTGAALLVDAEAGVFRARPATYAGGVHTFTYPAYPSAPQYVEVSYIAGYPPADGATGWMDARLEAAVVRLANVLSPDYHHPLNDLAEHKWRSDRAMPAEDNPLRPDELNNPFGYAAGARFAWDTVRQLRNYPLPFVADGGL